MPGQARRSVRLFADDYQEGAFFLTLCAIKRRCLFGQFRLGRFHLTRIGEIVKEELLRSKSLRKEISLDALVIMPNHLHAIVWHRVTGGSTSVSRDVGAHCSAPLRRPPRSLASFVAGFKASVVGRVHALDGMASIRVWQRGYYDRVIRTDEELNLIRRYILENPLRWDLDHLYVSDPSV